MVKDITHENIWNGLDLALGIDGIIISCDIRFKFKTGKVHQTDQNTQQRFPEIQCEFPHEGAKTP